MTAQSVYQDIINYLATTYGTDQRGWWYVGIASDINKRLFGDHNVSQQNGHWIWRKTLSADHARAAESLLLQRGHDGGTGGGDLSTVYVYAFRKDPGTLR